MIRSDENKCNSTYSTLDNVTSHSHIDQSSRPMMVESCRGSTPPIFHSKKLKPSSATYIEKACGMGSRPCRGFGTSRLDQTLSHYESSVCQGGDPVEFIS